MKEYMKAQIKTNTTILNNAYSLDEIERFSKADYRWADLSRQDIPGKAKSLKSAIICVSYSVLPTVQYFRRARTCCYPESI